MSFDFTGDLLLPMAVQTLAFTLVAGLLTVLGCLVSSGVDGPLRVRRH